jgi:hypothetical protein
MDGINDILSVDRFSEPPEIAKIKSYIKDKYNCESVVQLRAKDIIISVDNAALANSLRLSLLDIKKSCGIEKKLIFRISN